MTIERAQGPDGISVSRWFILYAILLTGAATWLWVLLARQPAVSVRTWSDLAASLYQTSAAVKLLVFGIYLSICCTFLPLNTGWIVAACATHTVAVGSGLLDTALLVASVGAAGSTVANLNDYHLFTLMLRSRRIARIRSTRTYRAAERWFARSPFFLLVVFNVLPIPVDVVRPLAATHRYGRLPFAAANFVGRFIRYGAIALVTYWWELEWVAVVVLLALGLVMSVAKAAPAVRRRLAGRNARTTQPMR